MATTVWKGYIAFGLVSVPVRLFRAARAERVPLRQLYRTPRRVRDEPWPDAPEPEPEISTDAEPASRRFDLPETPQAEVAPVRRVYERPVASDEPRPFSIANGSAAQVAPRDLVKGYEYEKGRYVVVDEQDLRALAPKTTTEIEIVEFVRFETVDPVYLETSYYVVPEENGEKAYALLFDSMRQTGYAAVGQLAMHRRDHVVIVRPSKTGLLAHTMFYPEEVRSIQEFRTDVASIAPKELDLAKTLIQALAAEFDPGKFKNSFQERLRELIESRVAGHETATAAQPAPAKVVDIMDALKRSLAQVSPAAEARTAMKKPARGEHRPAKEQKVNARKAR